MAGVVEQSDMIIPLACGLAAALGFVVIAMAFRNRSDARDQTLPPPSGDQPGTGNPPGWVTSDSTPPPAPVRKPGLVKTIIAAHELMTPENIERAKQMKDQGASVNEILTALGGGPGGAGDMLRAVLENAVSGKQLFAPGTSGTFQASVAIDSGSVHESFQMDKDSFNRARALIDQGASVDDICRAINPPYAGWEPDHQKRFHHMVTTLLRMGGVEREKLR